MSTLRVTANFVAGMLREGVEIHDGDKIIRIEEDAIAQGVEVSGVSIDPDHPRTFLIHLDDGQDREVAPVLRTWSPPVGKRLGWVPDATRNG